MTDLREVDLIQAALVLQESLGQAIDEFNALGQHDIAAHLLHALEYSRKRTGIR